MTELDRQRVRSEEEFQVRFAGLTDALLDDPDMFGYCYTQLTDVFQEENGIYRFDRTSKLDVERVRAYITMLARKQDDAADTLAKSWTPAQREAALIAALMLGEARPSMRDLAKGCASEASLIAAIDQALSEKK